MAAKIFMFWMQGMSGLFVEFEYAMKIEQDLLGIQYLHKNLFTLYDDDTNDMRDIFIYPWLFEHLVRRLQISAHEVT